MFVRDTDSPEATDRFAQQLGEKLQPGDVLTLTGDLGAGKTTFTKGLAQGLGVRQVVNSPTFTIIKEYEGRLPLYHMDVYRLDEEEDLGFDEYFEGDGVTVIEWPDRIDSWLPANRLDIEIKYKEDTDKRSLVCHPKGERFEKMCEELIDDERAGN